MVHMSFGRRLGLPLSLALASTMMISACGHGKIEGGSPKIWSGSPKSGGTDSVKVVTGSPGEFPELNTADIVVGFTFDRNNPEKDPDLFIVDPSGRPIDEFQFIGKQGILVLGAYPNTVVHFDGSKCHGVVGGGGGGGGFCH